MNYLEIYIDEFNDNGIQIANAFLDVMRYKLTALGADSTDTFANVFDNSDIETEQYSMNILSEDLKPIVSDLRNIHMKDTLADSIHNNKHDFIGVGCKHLYGEKGIIQLLKDDGYLVECMK